jgi:hypothetical protein
VVYFNSTLFRVAMELNSVLFFGNAGIYFNSELQLICVEVELIRSGLTIIVTILYIAGWSARQAAVL